MMILPVPLIIVIPAFIPEAFHPVIGLLLWGTALMGAFRTWKKAPAA